MNAPDQSKLLNVLRMVVPRYIVHTPPGLVRLSGEAEGQPIRAEVLPSADLARDFRRKLLEFQQAAVQGRGHRPFIDVDHDCTSEAAHVKDIIWRDGRGIMLEVDWQDAGLLAVYSGKRFLSGSLELIRFFRNEYAPTIGQNLGGLTASPALGYTLEPIVGERLPFDGCETFYPKARYPS
jgi:hypothetical protein